MRVITAVLVVCCSLASYAIQPDEARDMLLYVGTYTHGQSKGIYAFRLQESTATPLGLVAETPNPTFLAVDAKRRLLFAVNETNTFQGKPSGSVSAFSIDPKTATLHLLNQQTSMGTGPCHLVLDKSGRNVLVANYNSGSVAVFPIEADGHLDPASDVHQHAGGSVNPQRQKGPHAHCVTLGPAEKFAFVCDLGLDKVMIYRFDADHHKLTPNDPPFASVKPGSGPRHMVFGSDGKHVYVVNELSSTITAFAFDSASGALNEIQTISTLPAQFEGKNIAAEIAVHPSGKFLYASNRGADTIAIFAIDPDSGRLRCVGEPGSGGKTPRHFALAPAGNSIIICNQDSDTLLLAGIDPGRGLLKLPGLTLSAPSPTCAVYLPALAPAK